MPRRRDLILEQVCAPCYLSWSEAPTAFQQLQFYVPAARTRILEDLSPRHASVHYTLLQTVYSTSISSQLSCALHTPWRQFEWNRRVHHTSNLLSPNGPRPSSRPPASKVEVTVCSIINTGSGHIILSHRKFIFLFVCSSFCLQISTTFKCFWDRSNTHSQSYCVSVWRGLERSKCAQDLHRAFEPRLLQRSMMPTPFSTHHLAHEKSHGDPPFSPTKTWGLNRSIHLLPLYTLTGAQCWAFIYLVGRMITRGKYSPYSATGVFFYYHFSLSNIYSAARLLVDSSFKWCIAIAGDFHNTCSIFVAISEQTSRLVLFTHIEWLHEYQHATAPLEPQNSGTAKSARAAGQLRHRACGGFLARNSPRALNLKEKWRRSCRKWRHFSLRGDDKIAMWICRSANPCLEPRG